MKDIYMVELKTRNKDEEVFPSFFPTKRDAMKYKNSRAFKELFQVSMIKVRRFVIFKKK